MRRKILKNGSLLISISILLAFLLIELVSYRQFFNNMKEEVKNETRYVEAALNQIGENYLSNEVNNASTSRITLIDSVGTVLYDTAEDAEKMENHKDRQEVKQAMENGSGEVTRLSATLGETTYYYAVVLEDGTILRMSHTVDSVFKTMMSGITFIALIIIGVILLNMFLVGKFTARLVKPINDLDLENPLENEVYEELTPLLRRIHKQNLVIEQQVAALNTNHQEYLAITDNMQNGLIVTNQTVVLSINKSAQKIFKVRSSECVGETLMVVSRLEELKAVWDDALQGKTGERMVTLDGKSYQFLGNPVLIDGKVQGAVILFLDVTEKEQAEQMRREFSANVSHELKTPLMSISGYAELIENGMVKSEDIPGFAGRIHSEASRLSSLVEDIIRLSQLDELQKDAAKPEEVDLYQLSQEVCDSLKMQAEKKHIQMLLTGERAVVSGVRQILYEMIFNLCDNAVKYNREHGVVSIQVQKDAAGIQWTVTDTGIGIPQEEQDRIFERFYRVDKSHSRETGGTGLGLSIVKHGAALHEAVISVSSKVGEGTVVSLRFSQ